MEQEYVFVRRDSHCNPFQRPYDSPFRVIKRSEKTFRIDLGASGEDNVSIDRLRRCDVDDDVGPTPTPEKRRRGRPKKNPEPIPPSEDGESNVFINRRYRGDVDDAVEPALPPEKRRRGRPPKNMKHFLPSERQTRAMLPTSLYPPPNAPEEDLNLKNQLKFGGSIEAVDSG